MTIDMNNWSRKFEVKRSVVKVTGNENVKEFCTYLHQKWINLHNTKTAMILCQFYMSSDTFHQQKMWNFLIFVCMPVTRLSFPQNREVTSVIGKWSNLEIQRSKVKATRNVANWSIYIEPKCYLYCCVQIIKYILTVKMHIFEDLSISLSHAQFTCICLKFERYWKFLLKVVLENLSFSWLTVGAVLRYKGEKCF